MTDWIQPKIDVQVGFEPGPWVGRSVNAAIDRSPFDWFLHLDHDILLLNPHWYIICQEVIRRYPNAGMFTCWCNNTGGKEQLGPAPKTDSVAAYREISKSMFFEHGYDCTPIRGATCSGHFLLVSKSAWQKVGKFPSGHHKTDWIFGRKMDDRGIPVFRINGLYIYHLRDRRDGSWIDGVQTSKEWRDERKAKGKK